LPAVGKTPVDGRSRFLSPVRAALLAAAGIVPGLAPVASPRQADMTVVRPEAVGFSSERLARLRRPVQEEVDPSK